MDENDALSEYNNWSSKLRSALHINNLIVIPRFISRANTAQS